MVGLLGRGFDGDTGAEGLGPDTVAGLFKLSGRGGRFVECIGGIGSFSPAARFEIDGPRMLSP